MTLKSSSQIVIDADVYINDNITEDISAGDVRDRIKDIADSMLNKHDGGLVLQTETGYSTPITPGSNYSFATKKYVDDGLAGVSPVWGSITGTVTDQTDLITYLSTNYQPAGSYVPTSRTLTINGTAYDLSANRSWTVGDLLSSGSYSNPTWITSLAWGKISSTPTTLSGYGITDAQPLATNLTSLSGLSYTSTSFVKMTAAGTFTLDTNTYASASSLTAYAKLDGSNMPFAPIGGQLILLKSNETFKRIDIQNSSGDLELRLSTFSSTNCSIVTLLSDLYFGAASYLYFRKLNTNFTWGTAGFVVNVNTGFTNYTGTAQNLLTIANGIKIGNNTDSAATAGAGSIRYASSKLDFSEGSNWRNIVSVISTNTKVTAGAPYTNDGYIIVTINGTDYKLMTTA